MNRWLDFLISRRGVFYLATRFGGDRLKRHAMDLHYRSGHWNYSVDDIPPLLIELVEAYARHGSILDLGCGNGCLAAALDGDCYASYKGVDLSPTAITTAQRRNLPRADFAVEDFEQGLATSEPVDLVVMEESIYYIQPQRLACTLADLADRLQPGGSIVATLCQPRRFRGIIEHIRREYQVVTEGSFLPSRGRFLVFRPR